LDDGASRRTLDCLRAYAQDLDRLGVLNRQVVGTSALRDIRGGEGFLDEAERIVGVRPRVLSGNDEAHLTFGGALSGLDLSGSATVFDVGGGSTEVVAGSFAGNLMQISCLVSIDVGAVRLHERHVKHDPPLLEELVAVRQDARSKLPVSRPYRNSRSVIGVAGTVTTLSAISKQMADYDGEKVHGGRLGREEIQRLSGLLAQRTASERRHIPGLAPGRADVIVTGTLIVLEMMDWLEVGSIVVSDRGLRWGLVEQRTRIEDAQLRSSR
jgi:exopolyphosphatase/guanosine-5'-triphosphate,3'-diphosphate pyrophosphatase